MKESQLDGNVQDVSYIKSKDNVADLLTRYKAETQEFKNIFKVGKYEKLVKNLKIKFVKREHGKN